MNKDLEGIMDAPDKRASKTNHLLARLYRGMLCELDIGPIAWNTVINRYYQSPFSRVKKNSRDIASDRNNFNRAIAKDTMSWNNFFKALCIVGPKWIRFEVHMGFKNGTVRTVSVQTDNPMAALAEQGDGVEEHLSMQPEDDTEDEELGETVNGEGEPVKHSGRRKKKRKAK